MFVILRSFNDPHVVEVIRQLERVSSIKHVAVAIDAAEDPLDTPSLLARVNSRLKIDALPLMNYGWSKALNHCLRNLPAIRNAEELVLIVSNSVTFDSQQISLLAEAASRPGSSCGYALFRGRSEPTYQLPRNTFIVWKRKLIQDFGPFDVSLDGDTGMEDYDMTLRIFQRSNCLPHLGPESVELKLTEKRHSFGEKLDWETRGVRLIEDRYPPKLVRTIRDHISRQNSRTDG